MYSYSNPPTQPGMELKVNLIYRTELELHFWMKSLQIILSRVSVVNKVISGSMTHFFL